MTLGIGELAIDTADGRRKKELCQSMQAELSSKTTSIKAELDGALALGTRATGESLEKVANSANQRLPTAPQIGFPSFASKAKI